MKTIATIILLLAAAVLLVACTDDRQTDAIGCGRYTCTATNLSGTYCRISSTGYTAYPNLENNTGQTYCLNRATAVRGVWVVPVEPTIAIPVGQCLVMDNATFCFSSSIPGENETIREMVQ